MLCIAVLGPTSSFGRKALFYPYKRVGDIRISDVLFLYTEIVYKNIYVFIIFKYIAIYI
jgi:hypothetical protein